MKNEVIGFRDVDDRFVRGDREYRLERIIEEHKEERARWQAERGELQHRLGRAEAGYAELSLKLERERSRCLGHACYLSQLPLDEDGRRLVDLVLDAIRSGAMFAPGA